MHVPIDRYRRLTLRAKLALHVSVGVLLIVVALVLLSLFTLRRDITATVTEAQSALVAGVVADLDDKLQVRRSALALESVALGPRVELTDPRGLADFFVGRPLLSSLFDELILADASGRVVYDATARTVPQGRSIADRDYFRAALRGTDVTLSRPLVHQVLRRPTIALATAVFDARGEVAGVVVGLIHLDSRNFVSDVGRQRIGSTGYLTLATRDAAPLLIAHPNPALLMQPAPPDAGTAAAAGHTVEGVDADGVPALMSRRPLATAPWAVEAVYPTAEAFASLRQRQHQVLAIGLAAAVVSFGMVWLLTTRLLAPMGKLRRALELDATGSEGLLQAIQADSADVAALLDAYYEQKRRRLALETAVATSERRLRCITDNLPALIGYIDRDEVCRFANERHREWVGRDPAELIGRPLGGTMPPETYASVKPHIEAALRGEHQRFEHSDGGDGPCAHRLMEYVPEVDADGRVAGFFAMVFDITERREAELKLAQSEQRIRAITDNLPAMISHFDRDMRYTFTNSRVGQVFGRDAAELVGRSLTDLGNPRLFEALQPQMARALAGEQVSFETSSRELDGSLRHFESNYIPETDATGAVLGVYALTLEVTARKEAERQLRESERLLDRTGRMAGVGGWEVDLTAGTLTWTAETRRIHEVDDDYLPTLETAIEFYVGDARRAIEQAVEGGLASGLPWDIELPLRTARGRSVWVRATGEVEQADGRPVRMFGAFQDVTRRVAGERRLREQAELLHVTLQSIGDGVITADEGGRVRWMNPAAERMTGRHGGAARGCPIAEVFCVIDADSRLPAADPLAACAAPLDGGTEGAATGADPDAQGAAGDRPSRRRVLVSATGEEFAIEDTASPIRDADGRRLGAVLVFHDVSEQRRLADELTHRATHDALTGLVNRAEFESRLVRVLAKMRESNGASALLFIDLDQFKLVNDACGHAMGDKLLCQVSALMAQCVRHRDTLSRLGGDEFGIILEHCTVEQAQRVAQGICDRLDEFRFIHEGRRFRIGASIGLVPIDARWRTPAALKKAADTACYAAKEGGRNRVHLWFDTDQALRAREGETHWGSRLEQALDEGGFVLFAQQVMPLREPSRRLHFEVLLRLREPDGCLVAPGSFLPAAERFHMAPRIDRWVLREVLGWLAAEGAAADDVETVSVNLSGQSIGDTAFHRDVVELLDRVPIDARKLCFEVTETAAITHLEEATLFIRMLRERGVRFALDDFGAGASSFGYLKHLPVDFLKIDGQFIRHIETDPLDIAAVRCFHEVARAIGIRTVAEFVETDAILAKLDEIGIDYVQGYLVHRPEPLEALVARFRAEARMPAVAHGGH